MNFGGKRQFLSSYIQGDQIKNKDSKYACCRACSLWESWHALGTEMARAQALKSLQNIGPPPAPHL